MGTEDVKVTAVNMYKYKERLRLYKRRPFRACSSRCCGLSSVVYHGWEGKCSEILATQSYSKNSRVKKVI